MGGRLVLISVAPHPTELAPRIVWPRSLAVFTMTIIVKIGRIIAPPIAHRALISFKLLAFPIGRNSLLSPSAIVSMRFAFYLRNHFDFSDHAHSPNPIRRRQQRAFAPALPPPCAAHLAIAAQSRADPDRDR
jgi:hypothetical protein